MAKKKKAPPKGAGNAYLISFGDTMTTLLAFFIVLNSLAEDQTGMNLYQGTGSFSRAMNSFGLTGNLPGKRGKQVAQLEAPAPDYVVGDRDNSESHQSATGPDENPNDLRVIDREAEDFQRFVTEIARLSEVEPLPDTQGEAVFDFFNKLNRKPPHLTPAYQEGMSHALPLLHRSSYRTEVIVWSTSPSRSAWMRATDLAEQIVQELAQMANLTPLDRGRLIGLARPWIDSKAKRPTLSVVVRRVAGG